MISNAVPLGSRISSYFLCGIWWPGFKLSIPRTSIWPHSKAIVLFSFKTTTTQTRFNDFKTQNFCISFLSSTQFRFWDSYWVETFLLLIWYPSLFSLFGVLRVRELDNIILDEVRATRDYIIISSLCMISLIFCLCANHENPPFSSPKCSR